MSDLSRQSGRNTILVTGATGFVGQAMIASLERLRRPYRPVARRNVGKVRGVGAIDGNMRWDSCLEGVDSVVHLAARVHVMRDHGADSLAAFRKTNVDGTRSLALAAAAAGVRRFIFISSIKVNGELTSRGQTFTSDDVPGPQDAYGHSKWEAEQVLMALAEETGMEVVIIRPPLVYGPCVKANFLSMMQWLYKGIPLPLGGVHNKRSLIALDNLVDFIVNCIDHPAAANQTFLVSDGEDMSTTELLQRMAVALGKPARLLPVPAWLLKAGAAMVGKRDIAQRLLGSLQVDISKTREVLDWVPPVSVDEALKKTAEDFLAHQKH